jgi:hypothetical protein
MRSALAVFAVVACGGLAVLAVYALHDERDLAFTLGVVPEKVAAVLRPGSEACQRPVAVAEGFTRVRFQIGTYMRAGQPLAVTVRSAHGRRTLAGGKLAGGYADLSRPAVAVGHVARGTGASVCIRNLGTRRVALYGGPSVAARGSDAALDGRPLRADLTLLFLRKRRRSALALAPTVFRHASLFHPRAVGAWTFYLLAALSLVAVPALLGLAVHAAEEEG